MNAIPISVYTNNLIEVDFHKGADTRRTTSLYKSDGKPKPSAADPIRRPEEIKAIQEYFRERGQIRDYTLFTLGVCFGLRAGDLLSLRISNIVNPDGTFKLRCELIESKRRKFNNPIITAQLRELLSTYLASLPGYSIHDPLFASQKRDQNGNKRPITITQLNRILKAAAKATNTPGHISSHSLRKTFAYQLLKHNPNDDTVKLALQQMLNHDEFRTTLNYCGMTQDTVDGYRASLIDNIINDVEVI